MELSFIIQVALGGVLSGGIYALLALGMSLNLGLLNLMNLSHGSFLILGAVTTYGLSEGLGISPLLSMGIVPLLFGGLGGLLCSLLFSPLSKKELSETLVPSLLITLGLAFILEEVSASVLSHPLIGLSSGFKPWHWRGISLSPLVLILLSVLAFVMILLIFFLFRTDPGRIIRALPQDIEGALCVGVPLSKTKIWAWSLSLSAAGLAGVFWILLFPVTPYMGIKLTIIAFLMVMVVGNGQIPWALGAGFFWGILESLGSAFLGPRWGMMIPLSVFLLLLSCFPKGRIGT